MIHNMQHGILLLLTAAAFLVGGCTEEAMVSPELTPREDVAVADRASKRANGAVTVPFKAWFYTDLAGLMPDESCGDPLQGRFLNIQEGIGEATHLGRFSVRITFCIDVTDLLDDGQLTEGESLPYDNGVGTFTAANGDELWITISGAVLPSDHPDYDFEFADPFAFTGGTGRFDGASGSGVTDSFVDSEVRRTTHRWTGMLTLLPGM